MRLCKGSLAWHRAGLCLQISCYTKPEWFPENTNISFQDLKTVDFEAHPFPAKKHARFMIGNNFATTNMPRYNGNKASFPAWFIVNRLKDLKKTTWTWRGKSRENHGKNKSADRLGVRFTNSKQLESNWNFISSLMPPLKTVGCSTALGAKFISSNLQPTIQTVKQVLHWRCFACFWESYGWWKKSG